jgi:hypothetical protein
MTARNINTVLEALAAENVQAPVLNLGIPDVFMGHGSQARLKSEASIDTPAIIEKTLERLKEIDMSLPKPEPRTTPKATSVVSTLRLNEEALPPKSVH